MRSRVKRSLDRLSTTVTATATDGGHRLMGRKRFVPYGLQADLVIVNARSHDGTTALFAVDPSHARVERRPLLLLDGSPCAELRLDGVDLPASARIATGDGASARAATRCALMRPLPMGAASRCGQGSGRDGRTNDG